MVRSGSLFLDPFTVRTIFSVVAGAITALVVVRLTFFLHNQRDLFKSIRAIRSELEYNDEQLTKLSRLLKEDMQRQHVDLPIRIPAGTSIEVRYVLSLPSSLHTSAFDQLKQSGRALALAPETRRALFDLYDAIDRINRLCRHRETLHYNNVENVHIVLDHAELDVEPGATAHEADLPPRVRRQLTDLRQMRLAMRGLNTSILRFVTAISADEKVEARELQEFVEDDPARVSESPTIDEMTSMLDAFERQSFWARFV